MLSPVPYHVELKKFLKKQEAELWQWLASAGPEWFRTDPVLAHARLFSPDFAPTSHLLDSPPAYARDNKTKEYLGYVMLDFVAMDPELDDEPLKQAIQVADRWGLTDSFAKIYFRRGKHSVDCDWPEKCDQICDHCDRIFVLECVGRPTSTSSD